MTLTIKQVESLVALLQRVQGLKGQLVAARAEVVAFVKRVRPTRTPENMEQMANVMRALYGAHAVEGVTAQGSLAFKDAGAKAFWFAEVAPHLPKLRNRKASAAKSVDPVATRAKRLKAEFSAAQIRRLIAFLQAK